LHTKNESKQIAAVTFPFGGKKMSGYMWMVTPKEPHAGVEHLVFDHPDIAGEPIYYNDPPRHAFAKDATKYALFCSAVGMFLKEYGDSFVLHLHDWHTATICLLKRLHPDFSHLA